MCFYLTPKPHIAIYLSQTFNCLKLLSFEPSLKAMRDLGDWECSCNARMVHSLSILSFYCHFRLNTTCVRISSFLYLDRTMIFQGFSMWEKLFLYFAAIIACYTSSRTEISIWHFSYHNEQNFLSLFSWKWHRRRRRKFNSTSVSRDRENKDWKVEWSVSRRYNAEHFSFAIFFYCIFRGNSFLPLSLDLSVLVSLVGRRNFSLRCFQKINFLKNFD